MLALTVSLQANKDAKDSQLNASQVLEPLIRIASLVQQLCTCRLILVFSMIQALNGCTLRRCPGIQSQKLQAQSQIRQQ